MYVPGPAAYRLCQNVEGHHHTISHKSMNATSPNFGHRRIFIRRYADYILRARSKRSRSQQAMARKPGEYNRPIFVNI